MMLKHKTITTGWTIHLFALLHVLAVIFIRWAGGTDEILLTILTMGMFLIICHKKKQKLEFTAAVIIIGNILGYLLGTAGGRLFEMIISSPIIVHSLATALTTEILGWLVVATIRMSSHEGDDENEVRLSSSYMKWILVAVSTIMLIRICLIIFFPKEQFNTEHILLITGEVLTNSMGIIVLTGLTIIYVSYADKIKDKCPKCRRNAIFAAFMVLMALIETFIIHAEIPDKVQQAIQHSYPLLFVVSLIAQTMIYCIVYIINYGLVSRSQMRMHREKANLAQYRYLKLKRQVNPHFLFNSLNILDCLVCDEKTEQASIYIHKLASIYRYMIRSEDEELVSLREEMAFVGQYVDLLKVRFPEGFDVVTDVPEEKMGRFVLPCSVQLLVENATKHNAVSTDNPLIIRIEAKEDSICISNNLVPKLSVSSSTGLGQKYISRQYMDLAGKAIEISRTDNEYLVTLPLL